MAPLVHCLFTLRSYGVGVTDRSVDVLDGAHDSREDDPPAMTRSMILRAQNVDLDVQAQIVFRDGLPMPRLPRKEFLLLKLLLERAGRVVAREELLEQVWGQRLATPDLTKTLDVHVRRLRARIEHDPHQPTLIRTVRGFGYIFDTTAVPFDHVSRGSKRS